MAAYAVWGWWVFWFFLVLVPLLMIASWSTWRRNGYTTRRTYGWGGVPYGSWSYPFGPMTGRGPKKYHRSDERILEEINDRLMIHGDIDATDIDVQVKSGEVTLRGVVASRRERWLAEEIADSVLGVAQLHNELQIGATSGHGESEAEAGRRAA